MRRNIYIDKETEEAYNTLRPPLSLLVREILTNGHLTLHPARVVRTTPAPTPKDTTLDSFTLPDPICVLDERTALYTPSVADMDRLGATSAVVEWYDTSIERWRRSE